MFDEKLIWFLVGLGLMFLEFMAPGIIVVFFGVGAWLVALLLWLGWVESLSAQVLLFCFSSFVLLFALRRYVKKWFVGDTKDGELIEDEFLGKEVTVLSTIGGENKYGKVELKGATWKACLENGEEALQEGEVARVIGRDGLTLKVQKSV